MFPAAKPTLVLTTHPHPLDGEVPGCWGSPTCSDEDVWVPQQGGERRPLLALLGKRELGREFPVVGKTGVRRGHAATTVPTWPRCSPLAVPGTAGAQRAEWLREEKGEVRPRAPAHKDAEPQGPEVTARGPRGHTHSPPSKSTRAAKTRNGAVFPTNSYSTLPKGGPTARKTERGWYRAQDCRPPPRLEPSSSCSSRDACSVAQLCLTLCDPMDCSPPGSSIHGIPQARMLKWVAISYSRGSS